MMDAEEAVSGPDLQDNAGQTDVSPRKESGIDKAIAAAMGGLEDTDVPLELVKPKRDTEAKGKSKPPIAGDKSDSEDAAVTDAKPEANPAEAAPEGNAPVREAPKHWPEDRRKAFAGWPKEVQDHALQVDKDLQSGFTRKSQELGDKAKFADTVRGLFDDQSRQQMTHAGFDEVGYVRYLDSVQKYATSRPVEYVGWVMQALGVRPEHLGLSVANRQPDQHQQHKPLGTGNPELDALLTDPAVQQLRSEFGQFSQQAQQTIQQLQAKLAAREAAEQSYLRQQQTAQVEATRGLWNNFRSDVDDHGQLKYPHADTLMQSMGALMETSSKLRTMADGPEKLAKAYEMALKADPELSQPIIDAEVSRKLAEKERALDAQKAKRAAAIKPASGAPAVPVKKGGLDAALDAAFTKTGF